jgi:hypothetical protein
MQSLRPAGMGWLWAKHGGTLLRTRQLAANPTQKLFQLAQQAAQAVGTVGEHKAGGELYGYLCDEPVAVGLPPLIGFFRPEARASPSSPVRAMPSRPCGRQVRAG